MADSRGMSPPCPFCTLPAERIVDRNECAVAILDAYPLTPGHTLIVPTRHVASFFELDAAEQAAMLDLLRRARERLAGEMSLDAFNVGINDGPAAGQTVPHVHLHIIPRRWGDVADPRGGVRWVVPDKARYWE